MVFKERGSEAAPFLEILLPSPAGIGTYGSYFGRWGGELEGWGLRLKL